jgi:site-specific recombinase XerC
VKDRTYRGTPIGLEVAKYYRWKKNEWGATPSTLRDYEAPLGLLALDHADLELGDFEPPLGTERLREFWERHWAERSPRTRKKILSILRDFFAWAVREGKLHGDPTTPIRVPRQRGTERRTIEADIVAAIIAAQPSQRDRIALMLLFRLALRKSELAAIQFKHFGHDRKRLQVFGKGGTVIPVPVPDFIRQELAAYIALERPGRPTTSSSRRSAPAAPSVGTARSRASSGRTAPGHSPRPRCTAGGTAASRPPVSSSRA